MNSANIYDVGDILQFKKNHPCGANEWKVIKTGIDYKLECMGCKRIIIIPRIDLKKKVKRKIEKKEEN
ncbi:MAG: DUF951 domain-containing protein [Bacilli bacterium]|nr:DUF951 domain-containing protein [Bacilli bacterium]